MGLRGHISTVQLGGELPGTLVRLDYDFPFSDQWCKSLPKKDKGARSLDLTPRNYLARLGGFEPPTYGLEVRCSIQLSYRRNGVLRVFRYCTVPVTVPVTDSRYSA